MLGKPCILSFSPAQFINSIKHEHSCKILYMKYGKTAYERHVNSITALDIENTRPVYFDIKFTRQGFENAC